MSHGEKMRPSNNAPASVSRNESSQVKCTRRNSSTPIAITAEIDAIGHRGRLDAVIATKKTALSPTVRSRPYFTNGPGSPRLSPNPRRRQKPMRVTVGDRCRAALLLSAALLVMKSRRSPEASARTRFLARPREGGWRRHGRRAWRERSQDPYPCPRCHGGS
jgi:hypothetical protein